ncbi:PQQ-binding-like beta-propeller repeat protein [Georgenia sp. MJ206]|uniref:outer membrane protein assembly factor BamB family protein n=1 Tax=Georgenia wangjunii TaxID=3117730 RepID=UPI002F26296E
MTTTSRRPGGRTRALGPAAVLAALLAACLPTPPAAPGTTDGPDAAPNPVVTPDVEEVTTAPPLPDAAGVVPTYGSAPQNAWQITPEDLDVPGAGTIELYDPTSVPVMEGWPLVGATTAGGAWVVGVAEVGGTNQWLVALDPATGEQRSVVGLTRGDGPPTSCTSGLADGRIACLYGAALELVDVAAGEATARVDLPEPAFSVHELDGDIAVVSIAPDATALTLARTAPDGTARWTLRTDLDFEQQMAMTGSYVPSVQHVLGAALFTVGELHLMVDATDGTLLWHGIGDAVGPGPEGTVVASVRPQQAPGTPSEVQLLDAGGAVVLQAPGLTWRPPAASTGVRGTLVADGGAGTVGLGTDGARAWEHAGDPQHLRVPMVLADGVAVVQDTAGTLVALDAERGTELWRNTGGNRGWHVRGWGALTDGERMIARTPEGVIAVELATGEEAWRARVPEPEGQVWELVRLDGTVVAAGQRSLSVLIPAE